MLYKQMFLLSVTDGATRTRSVSCQSDNVFCWFLTFTKDKEFVKWVYYNTKVFVFCTDKKATENSASSAHKWLCKCEWWIAQSHLSVIHLNKDTGKCVWRRNITSLTLPEGWRKSTNCCLVYLDVLSSFVVNKTPQKSQKGSMIKQILDSTKKSDVCYRNC